ncbi:MAG: hypothetical protein KDA92_01265 [Planctomycetales bacterium]|nr:hypothetical protein [Planctomycetales bacterium]
MSRAFRLLLASLAINLALHLPAYAEKLIFADGQAHVIAGEVSERVIRIENGTSVRVSAKVEYDANILQPEEWEGNRGVLDVLNGSHLVIDDDVVSKYPGSYELMAVFAGTGSTIDVLSGQVRSAHVVLLDNSELNLRSGEIIADAGSGNKSGINLIGDSTANIFGGSVRTGLGDAYAYAIRASDRSVVNLEDGEVIAIADTFNAAAVLLDDEAQLSVSGGILDVYTPYDGSLTVAHLKGNSTGTFSDGRATISRPLVGTYHLFHLEDHAELEVTGGHFLVSDEAHDCPQCPTESSVFRVDDASRLYVAGGDFNFTRPTKGHVDLILNDHTEVTIAGRQFDQPMFQPIADLEGVVSGTLLDGSRFQFSFAREPNSVLRLIPEPQATSLGLWITLPLIRGTHRRRLAKRSAPINEFETVSVARTFDHLRT